ncbi:hypothetical protein [Jannaschia sp. R86511]|uniref:hypothetical protein n=1 Tax=Jannaschia sp. R86511 TaxID=3093853 RepID=UPI0036D43A7C
MTETRYSDGTARREAEYTARGHRPTRWPHPDVRSIGLFAIWTLGVAVSTVVPFILVPPTSAAPDPGQVGLAFAATMLGVAIFVGAGLLLWRHLKVQSVLVFALVPAVSIVSGGVILTATLLAL